jgi:hypothetical protein
MHYPNIRLKELGKITSELIPNLIIEIGIFLLAWFTLRPQLMEAIRLHGVPSKEIPYILKTLGIIRNKVVLQSIRYDGCGKH